MVETTAATLTPGQLFSPASNSQSAQHVSLDYNDGILLLKDQRNIKESFEEQWH